MITIVTSSDYSFFEELIGSHKAVFPKSFQIIFGDRYISSCFKWYTLNPTNRQLIIYREKNKIIGFLTIKKTNDKEKFINYIFGTLIVAIIKNPLILIKPLFIKKIFTQIFNKNSNPQLNNCLELISLGILPSHKRKGIGQLLMNQAYLYARENKLEKVIGWPKKLNKNVKFFFLNDGWKESKDEFGDYKLFYKEINID